MHTLARDSKRWLSRRELRLSLGGFRPNRQEASFLYSLILFERVCDTATFRIWKSLFCDRLWDIRNLILLSGEIDMLLYFEDEFLRRNQ